MHLNIKLAYWTINRLAVSPQYILLIVLIFLAVTNVFGQTGPGGVGNSSTNKIWLKADALPTIADNSKVAAWWDQSGNNMNAWQNIVQYQPIYKENTINGLPVLRFDRSGGNQYLDISTAPLGGILSNSNTVFVVAKTNTGPVDASDNDAQAVFTAPGYHSTMAFSGAPASTTLHIVNFVGKNYPGVPDASVSNSYAGIVENSWQLITKKIDESANVTTLTGFANGSPMGAPSTSTLKMTNYLENLARIGAALPRGVYNWGLNGDIAEIILYSVALNEAQRIIVENYLSSKYNHSISNDLYSFDGAGEFQNDVAGIGRVDGTNIHISANSSAFNISNPLTLNNGDFLLMGHNNQSLQPTNPNAPVGLKRSNRIWRIDLTGNPGPVTVSIDVHTFSTTAQSNIKVLVDEDGDFSNATISSGTVTNGVFQSSSPVQFQDGNYVAIGYIETFPDTPINLEYQPQKISLYYGNDVISHAPTVMSTSALVTYSLVNPPNCVTIHPTTGAISLTYTDATYLASGKYDLTVTATNINGASVFQNALSLNVLPIQYSTFQYQPQTVSLGNSIIPMTPSLAPYGYNYALESGDLKGLVLNASIGVISGTMSSEGSVTAVIRATSKDGTGSTKSSKLYVTSVGNTGPGGVGGASTNKIWLDANALTGLSSGNLVSTFSDRSGNGWNAVQSVNTKKPTFQTNQVNGRAVVRFQRGSSYQYLEVTSPGVAAAMSNSNTVVIVAKASSGGLDANTNTGQSLFCVPGWHTAIYFSGNPNTTSVSMLSYLGDTYPQTKPTNTMSTGFTVSQNTWQIITREVTENYLTAQHAYSNGMLTGEKFPVNLPMTNYTADLTRIGVANLSGSYSWPLNGDIAEVVFYNVALNEAQRTIVENYVSAKYNIPISNDKYTGNDPAYSCDMQGIGTIDGTNANKHFKSAASGGLHLSEANNSLNQANEFLLAGHALPVNSIATTEIAAPIGDRWSRSWYIEKTGTLDARLSFDFSEGGISTPTNLPDNLSQFRLLYRAGNSGTFTLLPVIATLENDDQISFDIANANLQNGYYTLGKIGESYIIWSGAVNSEWNLETNWNMNRIPGPTDIVKVGSCTTCPKLTEDATIMGLDVSGGTVNLEYSNLMVTGFTFLVGAKIKSNNGTLSSMDFTEVKNSLFSGKITLAKSGGSSNSCYGGNTFSCDVTFMNASLNEWSLNWMQENRIINVPIAE